MSKGPNAAVRNMEEKKSNIFSCIAYDDDEEEEGAEENSRKETTPVEEEVFDTKNTPEGASHEIPPSAQKVMYSTEELLKFRDMNKEKPRSLRKVSFDVVKCPRRTPRLGPSTPVLHPQSGQQNAHASHLHHHHLHGSGQHGHHHFLPPSSSQSKNSPVLQRKVDPSGSWRGDSFTVNNEMKSSPSESAGIRTRSFSVSVAKNDLGVVDDPWDLLGDPVQNSAPSSLPLSNGSLFNRLGHLSPGASSSPMLPPLSQTQGFGTGEDDSDNFLFESNPMWELDPLQETEATGAEAFSSPSPSSSLAAPKPEQQRGGWDLTGTTPEGSSSPGMRPGHSKHWESFDSAAGGMDPWFHGTASSPPVSLSPPSGSTSPTFFMAENVGDRYSGNQSDFRDLDQSQVLRHINSNMGNEFGQPMTNSDFGDGRFPVDGHPGNWPNPSTYVERQSLPMHGGPPLSPPRPTFRTSPGGYVSRSFQDGGPQIQHFFPSGYDLSRGQFPVGGTPPAMMPTAPSERGYPPPPLASAGFYDSQRQAYDQSEGGMYVVPEPGYNDEISASFSNISISYPPPQYVYGDRDRFQADRPAQSMHSLPLRPEQYPGM